MDDAVARSYGMNAHPSLRFGHEDLMLDDDTVDRLIDGLAADDAPPAYEWVAEAMAVLRVPSAIGSEAEDHALALFRAARDEVTIIDERRPVRRSDGLRHRARHRSTAGMSWRARRVGLVAGAVAGLSLASATSAAAMTGALPAPAQRAAHAVMSVVGVNVPAPAASHLPPAIPAAARVAPPGTGVPPATARPFTTSHPGASVSTSSASAGHGDHSPHAGQQGPASTVTAAPGTQNGGPSQGRHGGDAGQQGQSGGSQPGQPAGSQQGGSGEQGGSGQQGGGQQGGGQQGGSGQQGGGQQGGGQQGQGQQGGSGQQGGGQQGQGQQGQSGGGSSGSQGRSSDHGHGPH